MTRTHYRKLAEDSALCGQHLRSARSSTNQSDVTCSSCLKRLDEMIAAHIATQDAAEAEAGQRERDN